jgi:protocatechuate 3,4-dioxygenase beta subunit
VTRAPRAIDRRELLALAAGGVVGLGCAGDQMCPATPPNSAGPFYLPGAPERGDLVAAGAQGEPIRLRGLVLSAGACAPIADARIELWQADGAGVYDEDGFELRATLLSAADGTYQLRTVMPGNYMDGGQMRPAHIHARIIAPGREPLVTQVYFAGDPYLAGDSLFRPELLTELVAGDGEPVGDFDFVLA